MLGPSDHHFQQKTHSVKSYAFDQRQIGSEPIWRPVTRLLSLGQMAAPNEKLALWTWPEQSRRATVGQRRIVPANSWRKALKFR